MEQHITYHPVGDDLIERYLAYVAEAGREVASEHCDQVGMTPADKQRFVDLVEYFASPADYPFDQTHGFSIALTQGFFGTYYYVNDARLSSLGEIVASYTRTWQEASPDWPATETAQNTLLSQFSSGVFLGPAAVGTFMSDAHARPELTAALAEQFPGEKLNVLWAALAAAHDAGAGLLEAAGAIEPNVADLASSVCYARLDLCDPASLQIYAGSVVPEAPPAEPELPVPRHMQDIDLPQPGERLPTTPSLTERMRQMRGEDITSSDR